MKKISKCYIETMLFPAQPITYPISKTDDKHGTLMKANVLMDLYFDD